MIINLKLVIIDSNYCNYLRQFDNKVPYNYGKKITRPFVGVLFNINNIEYFVPLTSPKAKHLKMKNTIDFLKLNGGELGAINFNNMIPVLKNNYDLLDLETMKSSSERKYKTLLSKQLVWLNDNIDLVLKKSRKLYDLYNSNKLSTQIKNRCCNFKSLEEKCLEYNKTEVFS